MKISYDEAASTVIASVAHLARLSIDPSEGIGRKMWVDKFDTKSALALIQADASTACPTFS